VLGDAVGSSAWSRPIAAVADCLAQGHGRCAERILALAEKRVTIVTLQTLVNEYENYSSGYFDLIVIVPSEHLRPMAARARPFRRHQDRTDSDAVRHA
jgi:hypothetical protein